MQEPRSTEPVRILFLTVGMQVGGTERQIFELLRRIPRPQFDPRLGVLEEGGALLDETRSLDIPVEHFPRSGKWDFGAVRKIQRYLKTEQIDIIHAFLSPATAFGLGAATLVGRTIRVGSLRSSGSTRRNFHHRLLTGAERFLMRHSDAVVCNSHAGAQWGETLGLLKGRLRVIYNGMDASAFQTDSFVRADLQTGKIPDDAVVIGMVANFEADKGHTQLLEAVERLIPRWPKLYCVFIGDGPDRQRLQDRVSRRNLSERVFLPGVVYPASSWISRFDVAVLLSQQREGCSNFLIEAMFHEVPIVCSRVGGNVEVVGNEVTGFVVSKTDSVELGQRLESLLENPELRKNMGVAGRKKAESVFNIEIMTQRHIDLYQELIRKRDSGK